MKFARATRARCRCLPPHGWIIRCIACAITGMFDEQLIEENYSALTRHLGLTRDERAALDAAAQVAGLIGPRWLPGRYHWLDEGWRA